MENKTDSDLKPEERQVQEKTLEVEKKVRKEQSESQKPLPLINYTPPGY